MRGKYAWAHEHFYVQDDIVWFVPYHYCFLCAYNLSTKKTSIEAFLIENVTDYDRYINITMINNKIMLIPSYSDNLCVYDYVNKSINYYKTDSKCKGTKFYEYANLENEILIFPYNEKKILRISFDEKKDPIIDNKKFEFGGILGSCSIDGITYFIRKDNNLYEYNIDGKIIKRNFEFNTKFIDICQSKDNDLILLGTEGNIYKYDRICKYLSMYFDGDDTYHSISVASKILYAFPEKNGTYFDTFDLITGEKKRIYLNNKIINTSWRANAFSKSVVKDTKVYVMNLMLEMLLEIDSITGNMEEHHIDLSSVSQEEKKMLLEKEINDGCIIENPYIGIDLSQLLEFISK